MSTAAEHWLVIDVRSPSAELDPLLTEGLIASGGSAVEEVDGWMRTWLPAGEDAAHVVETIRSRLERVAGQRIDVRWERRTGEDWSRTWREGLGPRRVGQRLIVTPSWTPADAGTNDIVIVIDPKMAFGTGEHASTRGALRLLESRVRPGATVLDVGTGSAVLGIAAARLGARVVDAVEMDADALINAHENVAVNDCAGRVHLAEATVDDAWLESRAARYDIIVANILSSVLVPLLPAFGVALRDDGLRTLILGGILETERDVVVAAAERAGFRAASEDREDTWWAGALELRDPHDD